MSSDQEGKSLSGEGHFWQRRQCGKIQKQNDSAEWGGEGGGGAPSRGSGGKETSHKGSVADPKGKPYDDKIYHSCIAMVERVI